MRPRAVARPGGVPAADPARFRAAAFFAAALGAPAGGGEDEVCVAADEWCVAGMTAPVRVNVG
ncbi:hypothetical protein Shyhy01_47130 [Streptomyces hygroscopicus subsp. hygroscopicus]|nr:hypothetical protein Shyhy01_47130 [Streptomyces hygroscopicus subsp. hygroscopicus]